MLAVLFVGVIIAREMVDEKAKEDTDYRYDTYHALCKIKAQNEIEAKHKAQVRSFFKVPPWSN
jgi:hypothetical protein